MVWFVLAGMAAVAALAALWPVLRSAPPSADADASSSEAAFYKAQLDEIQRDVERGRLPQTEAASARAEAARRLIAVSSNAPRTPSRARPRARLAAPVLIATGVPALAFPLYALLGQPQLRHEPLASRKPATATAGRIEG